MYNSNLTKIKYCVYRWFIYAYIILYIMPLGVLTYTGELSINDIGTALHLKVAITYGIAYLIAGVILKFLFPGSFHVQKHYNKVTLGQPNPDIASRRTIIYKLANIFGYISTIIIAIYYLSGGYRKIIMLGSNIEGWEFRKIGFDDTNRILIAAFEVARRILMPFALLTKLSYKKYKIYNTKDCALIIFLIAAIFGAIVNLDRGPIFMYLTMFFFLYYITADICMVKRVFYVSLYLLIISIIGATVTYLQYNIFGIGLIDIISNIPPVIERIILAPVRMAEQYVFNYAFFYDNPLHLKHSKLMALFGGEYVGTDFKNSIFVTPVGLVGDVFRHFGVMGAMSIGLIHGIIFCILSNLLKKSDFITTLPILFLVIILILYLLYSGIFSQGPLALIIIIFFIVLLKRPAKANTRGV